MSQIPRLLILFLFFQECSESFLTSFSDSLVVGQEACPVWA